MGESALTATIKKIEIINKSRKEQWYQSVQIVLADIELNNENLIALRKFRPNEVVHVSIESAQQSLFPKRQGKSELMEGIVGEDEDESGQTVERVFQF
ncbi:hypothetical protein [Shouchella shacheensis]|uniref:hypothetical protein n=1 Tax=Shouchella shacheensis TaxID=1649580 RepID=UPI00073FDEE2|nr:hypothetical protein [Shouchella shacheensis]